MVSIWQTVIDSLPYFI